MIAGKSSSLEWRGVPSSRPPAANWLSQQSDGERGEGVINSLNLLPDDAALRVLRLLNLTLD